MKYKGLFISQCDDNGVLREVDGIEKECEGLYFMVMQTKITLTKSVILSEHLGLIWKIQMEA